MLPVVPIGVLLLAPRKFTRDGQVQITGKILVTGGAGYIGTHTVLTLQQSGYEVVILDNLSQGSQELVEDVLDAKLVIGDICDRQLLDEIFQRDRFLGVIHLAGSAFVAESMRNPALYYRNNVVGTLTLLEAMADAQIGAIVFASTCATYGIPENGRPISEVDRQLPINPYGASKLMVERLLADFDRAYGVKSVIFRFFNAAGADPKGRLGEIHDPEPHLIPRVLNTALGKHAQISIYGTDYPTPDGTCIRDYVHVCDLADAHVLGLHYLLSGESSGCFNLCNDRGFSVLDIIHTARSITGCPIPVQYSKRRLGDPAVLVGDSRKAKQVLGWSPRLQAINEILSHAWQWHQQYINF